MLVIIQLLRIHFIRRTCKLFELRTSGRFMGAFKEFVEDLTKKCRENKVPVDGNVSLYNATNNVSINPTPILVMVGIDKL